MITNVSRHNKVACQWLRCSYMQICRSIWKTTRLFTHPFLALQGLLGNLWMKKIKELSGISDPRAWISRLQLKNYPTMRNHAQQFLTWWVDLPVHVVIATVLSVADYFLPYTRQTSIEGGRRKVQPGLAPKGPANHWQTQVNELIFYWHLVRDGTVKWCHGCKPLFVNRI